MRSPRPRRRRASGWRWRDEPHQVRTGTRSPAAQRARRARLASRVVREGRGRFRRLRLPRPRGRRRAPGKTVSVRINGIDTHYMYRDLIDVVERAGHRLDTILVPKVGVPADVYLVDALLTQIEHAVRVPRRIGIEVLVETALGMSNVEAIAASSPRLEAMHFGVADYAASVRARTTSIGGLTPDYPGDQWHYGISRMVVACRARGLRAIDGPFGDFADADGYAAAARRAAALGCEGKWAIHPTQIDAANAIFTPSDAEVDRAKRILDAIVEAEAQGRGAAQLDGKMIDAASARMAQNIVTLAESLGHHGARAGVPA